MPLSLCRPGGCNLVMWHRGTPSPLLEIVLALPFLASHYTTTVFILPQPLLDSRSWTNYQTWKNHKLFSFSPKSPALMSHPHHVFMVKNASQHFTSGTQFLWWHFKIVLNLMHWKVPPSNLTQKSIRPDDHIFIWFIYSCSCPSTFLFTSLHPSAAVMG